MVGLRASSAPNMEKPVSADVILRSLLFCPANEPRKVAKLAASAADGVVLDLEDAVAASEKVAARPAARQALRTLHGPLRCVRVNAFETGLTAEDVAAVVCADLDAVVLPKVETVHDLRRLDRLIAAAEAGGGLPPGRIKVIGLVETAAAIMAAGELATHGGRLIRMVFGSGDLGNDLALPTIRGDFTAALAYGRSKLVYDARAAGMPPPLDGPFLNIRDRDGLDADTRVSRSLGHGGRVCIHPEQVAVANRLYAPDAAEVAFARKVVEAFAEAERRGSAAIAVEGTFIDYPIAYKAERIVRLADAIAARESGRADGAGGAT
jgi:citrate lyase subunit beta/citryl-CoA lyase